MDIGTMLGWIQAFFETLGIWETLKTAMTIMIVLATGSAVISFARGR
jgi:hypothetical protein